MVIEGQNGRGSIRSALVTKSPDQNSPQEKGKRMFAALEQLRANTQEEHVVIDTCQADGCATSTREGKPYCSQHIEHCDYIKKVLAEIARRREESTILDSGRWVAQNGHLVKEALLYLANGSYTAARLGRVLDISECAAATLVRMMSRNGLAVISISDTGTLTATRRTEEDWLL